MSGHETIQALLDELLTELENHELDAAAETAAELQTAYENLSAEERQRVLQSRAVYSNDETGDTEVETLAELQALERIDGGTRFVRVGLLAVVTAVTEGREELSEEDIDELIEIEEAAIAELQEAEAELETQSESADEIIDEETVPAQLDVSETITTNGPVAPDVENEQVVTIQNAGDELAESVDGVPGAGLPGSRGAVEEDRFGVLAAEDGFETAGEGVDLAIPVSHVAGHELGLERACVRYHTRRRLVPAT